MLLIALAGLLFSVVMFQSRHFSRATAIVGVLACACDPGYCLTLALAPSLRAYWLAIGWLFWMIWHLLVAWDLYGLAKE